MNRRKTHFTFGGSGAPQEDGDEYVFCGTSLIEGDFTTKEGMVTCKRCMKALAAHHEAHRKDMEARKAELYDEVWALAKSLGWMNVTDALRYAGPAGDYYKQLRKVQP
ncbi:hypothetical protein D3C77_370610 [compost metagenome]